MAVIQPRTIDKITMALAHLKRGAPKSFEELETELNKLCGERMAECMLAPPDKVHVAQGKAQQLHELVKIMASCIADAQQLENRLRSATKERT